MVCSSGRVSLRLQPVYRRSPARASPGWGSIRECRPTPEPPTGEPPADELTVGELAAAAGMTVRNVRAYAARGLLPPPRLVGRTGMYGPHHVARLALVREMLQEGYTLASIERTLEHAPTTGGPTALALHRALIAPWRPEEPEEMDLGTLGRQVRRALGPRRPSAGWPRSACWSRPARTGSGSSTRPCSPPACRWSGSASPRTR